MPRHKPNTIWIDGDACPKAVKEIIFKSSRRLNITVILVANSYQNLPPSDLIKLIVVDKGFDAADEHIIDQVQIHDLVITADIPLAAKVLKKKAIALNPRGEIYNENTICSILSMRDFMKELRDAGTITSGPAAFGPKDIKQFADSLNKLIS
ncbi:MAG: YaiI/YqxD family protein [Parachlamydiaceae bacterium]|nr:YaiI/YqxD family protein [Parachlamydiaceae bacterium]